MADAALNPLAVELNDAIRDANPHAFDMLSARGRALFFPKGILSQSAEAKAKAKKINATIGMAMENGKAMRLDCIMDEFCHLTADEALKYAPPTGQPDLRQTWLRKQNDENPSQHGKPMSLPIVTSALTHGLSIVGDLFIDPGDILLLPDKLWGNYRLIFATRLGARIVSYPFFDEKLKFNVAGFAAALKEHAAPGRKIITILNFPNNPIGYTPTVPEGEGLRRALAAAAESGANVVAVMDDAYFGLAYDDAAMKESLFATLAGLHPRLLAVRLDGATKEMFVWGFRVGFITYSVGGVAPGSPLFEALEKKTAGAIRGNISSSPSVSQQVVLRALKSPHYTAQRRAKYELLKARAEKLHEVLRDPAYRDLWDAYPFNSGYFMCVRLRDTHAEKVRLRLLDEYGIGVISTSDTDIRIAFSCVEVEQIPELVEGLRRAVVDVRGRAEPGRRYLRL